MKPLSVEQPDEEVEIMAAREDKVWQQVEKVEQFLKGIRAGIPFAYEQIDIMLRVIASAHPAPASVLDLGCGDGVLGRSVHAQYPHAHYVFADFSEPMLQAAQQALAPSERVQYVLTDFAVPTWTNDIQQVAPFDVIVSGYAIHHVSDERKRAVYADIYQLLTPGGVFVHMEHVAPSGTFSAELHEDYFIESLHRQKLTENPQLTLAEVDEQFRKRGDQHANKLVSAEAQCQWLRDVGFVDVDVFFRIFELAVFGGRKP